MKRMRISLRSLLIAISLCCALCGWLANEYRFIAARDAYWSNFNDHDFSLRVVGTIPHDPAEVPFVRACLGDRPTSTLLYHPAKDPDGEQLRRAQQLFPEAHIWGWPYLNDALPEGMERLPEDRYVRI
jgi:hypothetical protein